IPRTHHTLHSFQPYCQFYLPSSFFTFLSESRQKFMLDCHQRIRSWDSSTLPALRSLWFENLFPFHHSCPLIAALLPNFSSRPTRFHSSGIHCSWRHEDPTKTQLDRGSLFRVERNE